MKAKDRSEQQQQHAKKHGKKWKAKHRSLVDEAHRHEHNHQDHYLEHRHYKHKKHKSADRKKDVMYTATIHEYRDKHHKTKSSFLPPDIKEEIVSDTEQVDDRRTHREHHHHKKEKRREKDKKKKKKKDRERKLKRVRVREIAEDDFVMEIMDRYKNFPVPFGWITGYGSSKKISFLFSFRRIDHFQISDKIFNVYMVTKPKN